MPRAECPLFVRLALALPRDAREVAALVEMNIELSFERSLYRFADSLWQMHVRCCYKNTLLRVKNSNDAVQRVVLFFDRLEIAHQTNNLVFVPPQKTT